MARLGLIAISRLDVPMFRAAAAGHMRLARMLAVAQDLVSLLLVRRPVYLVRPTRGL